MTTPDDGRAGATDAEVAEAADAAEAEAEMWRNLDADDPRAVARALAILGARAGARASLLDHMHRRIGRTLDQLTRATDALTTKAEMEERLDELEARMSERRRRDIMKLVAALVVAFTIVLGFVALNRAAAERERDRNDRSDRRNEAVAICTRLNDTPQAIHDCIKQRVP